MNLIEIIKEEVEKVLDEDYPSSFDMEHFKTLKSFNQRIKYCEEHLTRINSGSSRIVYVIDDEKVLKLAKNVKGLAQNEEEISQGNDWYLKDLGIVANIFDHHEENLWVEMELATKMSKPDFKRIVGITFVVYVDYLQNYHSKDRKKYSEEIEEFMWENEFTNSMLDYIGSYSIPVGDLIRTSTYGIVLRNGKETIVMIDYGLSDDVFNTHYKRKPRR